MTKRRTGTALRRDSRGPVGLLGAAIDKIPRSEGVSAVGAPFRRAQGGVAVRRPRGPLFTEPGPEPPLRGGDPAPACVSRRIHVVDAGPWDMGVARRRNEEHLGGGLPPDPWARARAVHGSGSRAVRRAVASLADEQVTSFASFHGPMMVPGRRRTDHLGCAVAPWRGLPGSRWDRTWGLMARRRRTSAPWPAACYAAPKPKPGASRTKAAVRSRPGCRGSGPPAPFLAAMQAADERT